MKRSSGCLEVARLAEGYIKLHRKIWENTFLNAEDSTSQILITSHYDPLMDEIDKGNLRPDSFWFTEKDSMGRTQLYSLVEFNGINSLKSIREAYRAGQLGALPHIID